MKTARILNIIALALLAGSFLVMIPILIYLSIGFLVVSIIFWRVQANKKSQTKE